MINHLKYILAGHIHNFLTTQKNLTLTQEEIANSIEIPEDITLADLAFPCFKLAGILKQSPVEIAQQGVLYLQNLQEPILGSCEQVSGYINIKITNSSLSDIQQKIKHQGRKYGQGEPKNQTLLIEGWQPNTHKSLHVGHLRNILLSESICRICEQAGYGVIRASYPGDIGAHVAKWIWYYQNFSNEAFPENQFSERAQKIYEQAESKLQEKCEEYKPAIQETQRLLEAGDSNLIKLRKETREKCLEDMHYIFKELGSTIQREYYESEVEQSGIQIVKDLVNKKIPEIYVSDGAIIANLEEYKLGVFVLLRSNETALYSTKDIGLALLKKQEFKYNKSLYIVATEQIHHFNQLFKTLELMGFDPSALQHISYGMVEAPDGKMSSRKGNSISYYQAREAILHSAKQMLENRSIDDNEKENLSKTIGFGALKFGMLLQDADKKIVFDLEKFLSFEGETGPYIQYTHARCCSILSQDNQTYNEILESGDYVYSPEERRLILLLAYFEETVQKAAQELKPNLIARYALTICQLFNQFYQNHKVLIEDNIVRKLRIQIVDNTRQVLESANALLGIESPTKM